LYGRTEARRSLGWQTTDSLDQSWSGKRKLLAIACVYTKDATSAARYDSPEAAVDTELIQEVSRLVCASGALTGKDYFLRN
jgi:hypothetical protein